jgi:hypothetical protein
VHGDAIDLRQLENARFAAGVWRSHCEQLHTLTDDERAEVCYAVTFAGLRFSSFYYRVRRIRPVLADALTFVMFASVWLIAEAIAFVILRDSIGHVSLAVDVWAGAATGWLVMIIGAGTIRDSVKAVIHRQWAGLWDGGEVLYTALGLLGVAIVIARVEDAAVTPREQAGLQLGAIALGAAGGLAAKRIIRTSGRIVERVLLVRDTRIRPHDDLITGLVHIAFMAHQAQRSRATWGRTESVRIFAGTLERTAADIERAHGLAGIVPWWQFRLRVQVAEHFAAVADVVRAHRVKVLAAQDTEEWRAICESLASGALAAARRDWTALTANAPAPGPTRRSRAGRTARRLSSTVVLLICAIILPQVLDLGAYGSSVRAILAVSGALALLPGDTSGVVREAISRAMPWRF